MESIPDKQTNWGLDNYTLGFGSDKQTGVLDLYELGVWIIIINWGLDLIKKKKKKNCQTRVWDITNWGLDLTNKLANPGFELLQIGFKSDKQSDKLGFGSDKQTGVWITIYRGLNHD
jgi:hypothetical protein